MDLTQAAQRIAHLPTMVLTATMSLLVSLGGLVRIDSPVVAQTPGANASVQAKTPALNETFSEYWVGWMDSSERQLRWVVQFNRTSSIDGPITSAATWNPDISTAPIQLSQLDIKEQYWTLGWKQPGGAEEIKYEAIQESDSRATGFLLVGDRTLAVPLNKVASLPSESVRDLGADIVWLDQLPPSPQNPSPKRFDLRLRFYTEGPFAAEGPRIVLDSMASKLLGVPVNLEQTDDEYLNFQIPSLKATYSALVSDDEKSMSGKFVRNQQESNLEMKLLESAASQAESPSDKSAEAVAKGSDAKAGEPPTMPEKNPATEPKPAETAAATDSVKINIQAPKESLVQHDLAPNEKAFTLDTKPASSRAIDANNPIASRVLGGTIRYSTRESTNPAPAVILLSTYGLQDRDGTIGKNKFYKQLATWFSEQGVTSVRVDDRGVGESLPISNMTSDDLLRDVQALLNMLKKDPKIDSGRIGLFGHGAGADLAMKVAAVDPSLAFTIVYAPSGVNGFALTSQRLIESALSQGISKADAEQLAAFQRQIQEIAVLASGDKTKQIQKVRELVTSQWTKVGALTKSKLDATKPADRSAIEVSLLEQVNGFDTPLMRDTLSEDPSTYWMLGESSTLAMFGEKDSVVPRSLNIEPLTDAALRSNQARFQFVAIPKVNHWFTSQAATESDLEEKTLELDPAFLSAIKNWIAKGTIQ